MKRQRVLVVGSTGSIGKNALQVIDGLRDRFEIVGLAASKRWEDLAEQIDAWRPGHVAVTDPTAADKLASAIDFNGNILRGPDALRDLVDAVDFDCAVIAVSGAAALPATIRAVQRGRRVAVANKESFVIAGPIMSALARQTGAEIIPIDSEHSAVFQAMHAGRDSDVARVVLTASGGPFRTWTAEQIAGATLEDALNHPTWSMGPKITIDSATMMNKALEIVEARWLFDLPSERISVVVHPESIVHSLVEFNDGSMIAQLGTPDMRTPIQYALTYPARLPCPSARLELTEIHRMSFFEPDVDRFPALRLGHRVAQQGGTAGAVLNAANEAAVQMFRDGAIAFGDIAPTVKRVLDRHQWQADPKLDDLFRADAWARDEVLRCLVS